jgi:hypothetical protein
MSVGKIQMLDGLIYTYKTFYDIGLKISPIDGVFVAFEGVWNLGTCHDVVGGVVVGGRRGGDGRVVIVHRVIHV